MYSFSRTFWNMGASSRLWGLSSVCAHPLPSLKAIESFYWPPCSKEETTLRFG